MEHPDSVYGFRSRFLPLFGLSHCSRNTPFQVLPSVLAFVPILVCTEHLVLSSLSQFSFSSVLSDSAIVLGVPRPSPRPRFSSLCSSFASDPAYVVAAVCLPRSSRPTWQTLGLVSGLLGASPERNSELGPSRGGMYCHEQSSSSYVSYRGLLLNPRKSSYLSLQQLSSMYLLF